MNTREAFGLLSITLTPGVGATLAPRLLQRFGTPEKVLQATPSALASVQGIGQQKARRIAEGLRESAERASRELESAARIGAAYVAIGDDAYPEALREIPRAPMLLSTLGTLDGADRDRFAVAIVGSRSCTAYGVEQAERFAGVLASAGVSVVSGGARGIDAAAHRGALRAGGRTIAVLGSGLARPYPSDNEALFGQIADSGGAVVSELPIETPPAAENFPARNRIISGMALGVLVIEASHKSGSLITARLAAEDHGREVFALPGRVDSASSAGSNELLKAGGAHLVTEPSDVLSLLESSARHLHAGTHAARYATPTSEPAPITEAPADPEHGRILEHLDGPMTPDELAERSSIEPGRLRAALTLLEIQGRVRRVGLQIERTR